MYFLTFIKKRYVKYFIVIIIIGFIAISAKLITKKVGKYVNTFYQPYQQKGEHFLEKNTWRIDKILGLDKKLKLYTLKPHKQEKFAGNLVSFGDGKFFSHYVAPCGNDYFTDLSGNYRFVDENTIEITVKEISYSGEWDKPTEYRKEKFIAFKITKKEDSITLEKQ